MEKYETLEIEVIRFEKEDVITTSTKRTRTPWILDEYFDEEMD